MQSNFFSYKDHLIHYRTAGEGKTVVLLHGFAEDGTVWQPQIDFLQRNFKLIVPDIPGSGQSQYIPGADIDIYAAVVKEIIEIEQQKSDGQSAGGEGISLIGHSMGGYITLAFAEKYPQYLNSFGLFHSTAYADSDEKKEVRKKAIAFIQSKGGHSFLKTSIPTLFTRDFVAGQPGKVVALIESTKNISDEALVQYYEAMINRPDRTDILKKFKEPVLFIIGEFDTAVPLQAIMQQCYIPAVSDVHILNHSAHMGMWEEGDKSNSFLQEFLQQV